MASSTSWRENSTRIIIWFGDAVGHDGDLEQGYPSRVGLDDVISALNNKDIIVEAVDVCPHDFLGLDEGFHDWRTGDDYEFLSGQATEITSKTGGKLFDGSDTSSIVTIINDALKDAFAEYSEVALKLSEEFSGLGVSISPARLSGNFDRSQERSFEFDIIYTGIETGHYKFDLLAKVDGGVVAVAKDNIEVKYQDCNGDWNGTASVDECGECVGGATGKTACVQDCNGDWGGTAFTDECGECVGGNTGKISTCAQDCNGDWNGTAFTDDCGECVGGNTGKISTCAQDCNGDWNGTAFTDDCGECVGGNTCKTACVQDCNGDWGEPLLRMTAANAWAATPAKPRVSRTATETGAELLLRMTAANAWAATPAKQPESRTATETGAELLLRMTAANAWAAIPAKQPAAFPPKAYSLWAKLVKSP